MVRLSLGGGLASQIGAGGRAPSGVLEVLGRFPVARGQTLVLLKMDRRILLLGMGTAGFSTLAEITDPDEVASLLVKTRDDEGETLAAKFNAMLRGMERDPASAPDSGGPVTPRAALRRAAERAAVTPRARDTSDADTTDDLARRLERLRSVRA